MMLTSHTTGSLGLGGLKLKTPLENFSIKGCSDFLVYGGNCTLCPIAVLAELYECPSLYSSVRKSRTRLALASSGVMSFLKQNFSNFMM